MNNLNRLVILVVLIGLLYLLYVYQEQLMVSEEPVNINNKPNDEEISQNSESSGASMTLQSSDLTMGMGDDLNSSYDSEMSDDDEGDDGLNFQVAE